MKQQIDFQKLMGMINNNIIVWHPLELIPEFKHKEKRRDDINAAIDRLREDEPVPDEWLQERMEIEQWLFKKFGTVAGSKSLKNKNMKPFDLSKALAGAPVVTRDGRKVEEIHLFNSDRIKSKLVVILEGEDLVHGYSIEGFFRSESDEQSDYDLFMAPVKKKGWVNLYEICGYAVPLNVTATTSFVYLSEESAVCGAKASQNKPIAIAVPIEWEE